MHDFLLINEWLAVAGICICILCGYRRWAVLYLIVPTAILVMIEYVAWPALAQLWPLSLPLTMQTWWLITLIFLIAPLIAAVMGFRLLARVLTFLFGAHAAGIFGGEMLIRLLLGRRRGRPIPQWENDSHE